MERRQRPVTVERYRNHVNLKLAQLLQFAGYGYIEQRALGMYVFDTEGNQWLDFGGGYGVFNMGHRHPTIVAAVHRQLDLIPLSPKVFFSEPLAALAERLAGILPGDLQYCFFASSGTEAAEGALKVARLATGRSTIIHAVNAFHGKTFGALSASGRDIFKASFAPLVPGFVDVPFGDLAALEAAVLVHQPAAVILEPIQGEGGINVPPEGYLQAVREVCTRVGALLILDEVQTGMGRTGRNFACEHEGVTPDIICLGKALGGGVMPLSAFVGTKEVWRRSLELDPTLHTSTFGGNPLACVAGLAAIDVLCDEKLAERADKMGQLLITRLQAVAAAQPDIIREVRGRGLLLGVEFRKEGFAGVVMSKMAEKRIIAVFTLNQPQVIRFEPPLTLDEVHIEEATRAFGEAVDELEQMILVSPEAFQED